MSTEFKPGTKVAYRNANADVPENGGRIGEVIEAGPPPDPSQVFVNWPSGRDAWERKDDLEAVGDATTYRLPLETDELNASNDK